MAELVNLLIEAAGSTDTLTRKNQVPAYSRWQRDGCDNSKYKIWKNSGSRFSLKKNLGNGKDRSWFNGDGSDSALSIGNDLYKDEEDKELNRELILATTSPKIDDYCLKKRGRESSTKVEDSEKEFPPPFSSSHEHFSHRIEKRPAAKTDALNELRAKRMRKNEPNSYQMLKDSSKTLKKMIEVKKSSSSRPKNVAVEKIRLKDSIETAESTGKKSEADRLRAKLKELEDLSRQIKPSDARSVRLLEMNRKNRAENYKKASELKTIYTNLKLGEEGYDPSARKWTMLPLQPVIYTNEKTTKAVKESIVTAMEEAKEEGKLIDTKPPVDHGEELMALHNFDLPISLDALNKFQGEEGIHQCFMLRKQKIESTIGHTVSDKYRKSNAFTLSISDYKRRRRFLS